MGDVIVELLPLIVGATVVPLYLIVVLFLLQSKDGLVTILGFVAGGIAMRLAQGLLFGLVFGAAMGAPSEDGQRFIVSTLLLIVGILLLVTAVKKWQKEEDPDAPSPRWMTAISNLSAVKAVGAGMLFVMIAVKQWVVSLSAIGVVGEAGLGGATNAGLYLCSTCWPRRRSCCRPSWHTPWPRNRLPGYFRRRRSGWSGITG